MPTLTEKAKESPKIKVYKITSEIVELALAWANDEVSITQVKKVLKVSENNKAYSILARALKEKIKKIIKKESNPHMVFSKEATEPAESIIKNKEKTDDKKTDADNGGMSDVAPGRY